VQPLAVPRLIPRRCGAVVEPVPGPFSKRLVEAVPSANWAGLFALSRPVVLWGSPQIQAL
jgi:hypothetical protein